MALSLLLDCSGRRMLAILHRFSRPPEPLVGHGLPAVAGPGDEEMETRDRSRMCRLPGKSRSVYFKFSSTRCPSTEVFRRGGSTLCFLKFPAMPGCGLPITIFSLPTGQINKTSALPAGLRSIVRKARRESLTSCFPSVMTLDISNFREPEPTNLPAWVDMSV